jgi:hypothetical protein
MSRRNSQSSWSCPGRGDSWFLLADAGVDMHCRVFAGVCYACQNAQMGAAAGATRHTVTLTEMVTVEFRPVTVPSPTPTSLTLPVHVTSSVSGTQHGCEHTQFRRQARQMTGDLFSCGLCVGPVRLPHRRRPSRPKPRIRMFSTRPGARRRAKALRMASDDSARASIRT